MSFPQTQSKDIQSNFKGKAFAEAVDAKIGKYANNLSSLKKFYDAIINDMIKRKVLK